jgi:site-specific DNA-methyltransferase (adenine-specific)
MSIEQYLFQIHNKDCIQGIAELPSECVDLVFADPPFNIGYWYDVHDDTKSYNEYVKWSEEWISQVYRVLKPNGTFWVAIGDQYAGELKIISQKQGFFFRNWVIWYYTFGVRCEKMFSISHTHLLYFVKNKKQFTFRSDLLENRILSAGLSVYNDPRVNPNGRVPSDIWILRPQEIPESFTPLEDTWYFPRICGTFKERVRWHPCQMPEKLLQRVINFCSNPQDIVLDPFAGSATTLVAAERLGRRWLGYEISERYAKLGLLRVQQVAQAVKQE